MMRLHDYWGMACCAVDKASPVKVAAASTSGSVVSLATALSASGLTFWMQVIVLFFAILTGAGSAVLAWMKVAHQRRRPSSD